MSTETTPPKRSNRKVALRAGTALLALCGVTAGGVSLAAASNGEHHRPRTLEVDIAEDGTRFVIDETPVFDDGFPAYGNPFITQGYIYPAGTLTDSNGVNPDGSPEFPDKVIGEWSCQGYFIADGAHTTKGSWVFTTQLFAFGNNADTGRNTDRCHRLRRRRGRQDRHRSDHRRHRPLLDRPRRSRPGAARHQQRRTADDGHQQDRRARDQAIVTTPSGAPALGLAPRSAAPPTPL